MLIQPQVIVHKISIPILHILIDQSLTNIKLLTGKISFFDIK